VSDAQDKVLVAMSGGVDSSVAAALLAEAGYDVTGVFLCLTRDATEKLGTDPTFAAAKVGSVPSFSRGCCSPQDAADARRVAQILGIPFLVAPAAEAMGPIMRDFVEEYQRGRTPNPCVHCNTRIKFGMLLDLADGAGIRYLATGHYARIIRHDGRAAIARGKAVGKDQSYVLFALPAERLERVLLPLGEMETKDAVRREARRLGLPVHDKPDSQEVCFVPDNDHAAFLRARSPAAMRGGDIVDSSGKVLGRHEGYGAFTIGQRHGLRVAAGVPMYVTRIDPASATVTMGPRADLLAGGLRACRANWHAQLGSTGSPTCAGEFDATVQIRYNHRGAPGRVRITGPETFEVRFPEPVSAVTPGQPAVVYDGDRLLGGGWIEEKTT
jgi:tRNA-specific 2-thiouridylase